MRSSKRLLLSFAVLALASPADLPAASAAGAVRYNRDIRPILSDNCFACHGPDANRRKGKLRLDVREEALARKAIVPGKPQQSVVVARIGATAPDELMPPPDSHKKLSAGQKDLLKRWIAEGAAYEAHWAFVPPVKAPLPAAGQGKPRPANPVDAFIQARLAQAGLSPSPEASRPALIRRVTLDLTGLPPTPAEGDAFVRDAADGAYERVVGRLLQSPHYGERMAVDWLDAARYADSNGYQVDRDRELWPWRDWVIRAFNANLPFDQFTIEQLAGDLLPNATLEQRVATGFHRNHMLNEEGGVLADEFLAEYTADRVETTATVWLGQTFNCARCHDHKFDPFTQRDFYALKAFFHNVPERGVGNYSNPIRQNAPPFVKLPSPELEAKLAGLNAKLKGATEQLAALNQQSTAGLDAWAERVAAGVSWAPVELLAASGGDQPPRVDEPARAVEIGPQETRANTLKLTARLPAGTFNALRFECATIVSEASFQWSELKVAKPAAVRLRAVTAGDSLAATESVKVLDNDRRTRAVLVVKPARAAQAVFELEPAWVSSAPTEVELELGVEHAGGPTLWRVFASGAAPDRLVPASVLAIAQKPAAQRTAAERRQLAEFRLQQQPEHRRLSDAVAALKRQVADAEGEIPTTLVMEELKEPRATFVLMRGAYDRPGAPVTAGTPAVLPALEEGLPRNRLGLARWLVSPQNPLTARVVVNRFWQQLFGTGLVRTSEDFGSQGEPPSHPELLDWLAVTFRESGWDVKGFLRLLVTSATYRQQSQLTPALRERDPENRLLTRGARHRLMGEFVRDQALAASGLLVPKLGGASVKPYHPPGLYEQITAGKGYNTYVAGKGDDLHRRSLYTYWKRSVPHPAMLLFDAPFRESCTLRRPRSNTPLQALNLMNDPTYVEAARWLAQRMMREGGDTTAARVTHGFRLLLARSPSQRELAVLSAAFERARTDFTRDPAAAKALLAVGEAATDAKLDAVDLAALTTVASTLLNLDEVVTKE